MFRYGISKRFSIDEGDKINLFNVNQQKPISAVPIKDQCCEEYYYGCPPLCFFRKNRTVRTQQPIPMRTSIKDREICFQSHGSRSRASLEVEKEDLWQTRA